MKRARNRSIPYVRHLTVVTVGVLVLGQLVLTCSRLSYQYGVNAMHHQDWSRAIHAFDQAEGLLPLTLVALLGFRDLERIRLQRGLCSQEQAMATLTYQGDGQTAFAHYLKSKSDLVLARTAAPMVYGPAKALARTEAGLELLSPGLFHGTPSGFNAEPLFQKAISLKPNGVDIRYSHLRYLFHTDRVAAGMEQVRSLMEIYPPAYEALSKESFFTPRLLEPARQGLETALARGIRRREAHQALADIALRRGAPDRAAAQYEKSLALKSFANGTNDALHMGRLLLAAGRYVQARGWFEKGLATARDKTKTLGQIYSIHKRAGAFKAFIRMGNGLAPELADPFMARAWKALGEWSAAQWHLNRMNHGKPSAVAHGLLAEIAGVEKDWQAMETHAYQALKLDWEGAVYHDLLTRALMQQRHYDLALESAGRAIAMDRRGTPAYPARRAWIWWALEGYDQAAADWKHAFDLSRNNTDFLYRSAQALERAGETEMARAAVEKAIELAPGHGNISRYRALAAALKGEG